MKNRLFKLSGICIIVAVLAAVFSLSGCYVIKQGLRLVGNASSARPVEELLNNPGLDADRRKLFELSLRVKRFSEQRLGLSSDRNFTAFVDLGRDWVAEVVSACKEDSFEDYFWKYPFFGAMPYKGFFYTEDAVREAERVESLGYDYIIRKVDAFSTLGYFRDPLYNFMIAYPPYELANLIIHEQTHATVFVKNNSQFNEELATFVGNEGALLFLREVLKDEDYYSRVVEPYNRDFNTFLSLMRELYAELDGIYKSNAPREEKLAGKHTAMDAFRKRVGLHYGEYFETDSFTFLVTDPINNAYISMWMQYTEDLSLYYELYDNFGRDLPAFIGAVKPLDGYKGNPKEYVRGLVEGE
ncbi:MAG: aminopeptidase [Spirochaetales bacterium]|nr:MAG: aminopeptidase [Spirochaetales bacterium]